VEDLADVERGEREHRDGDDREQSAAPWVPPGRGGQREGSGRGEGDERPRLDV
jgi:hypothetical protein